MQLEGMAILYKVSQEFLGSTLFSGFRTEVDFLRHSKAGPSEANSNPRKHAQSELACCTYQQAKQSEGSRREVAKMPSAEMGKKSTV